MSNSTPIIANKEPQRIPTILSWTGLSVFMISVLALAILFALSYLHIIHNIPRLLLYTPPSGVGGLGGMVGLTSLVVRQCKKKTPEASPINPPPASDPAPVVLPSPQGNKVQLPVEKKAFPFEDLPLVNLKSEENALAVLLLSTADFMALDSKGYEANLSLSLSFLIRNLEELKKDKIVDEGKLDSLIQQFQLSYQLATYQGQLAHTSDSQSYVQGRSELKNLIIEHLKKENTLTLNVGYAAKPAGHAVALKLTLTNGMVSGFVHNTGEGIGNYHSSIVGEGEKYLALQLGAISLEAFQQSTFLDLLIDLKKQDLFDSDARYNLEKDTLYSINDVYEVVLPTWPGAITDKQGIAHSQQHGGSCTLQPFLDLQAECLGDKDSKIAKCYLGLLTFNLLLEHVDFAKIDLERIKESVSKFNRSFLAADQQFTLSNELKAKVLELSNKIYQKIQEEEEKKAKAPLTQSIPIGPMMDDAEYDLKLTLGTPIQGPTKSTQNTVKFQSRCQKNNFSTYLKEAEAYIENGLLNKQTREAKKMARQVLLEIPNPSDPFWQEKRPEEEIHILTRITEILVKNQTAEKDTLDVTPNCATLYLKVLTIAFSQAHLGGVSDEVIALYGTQTKLALDETASRYCLMHPVYAEIFEDCVKAFQKFPDEGVKKRLILISDTFHKAKLDYQNSVTSLNELRKDIEMRFFNDFLQLHPEIKQALTARNSGSDAVEMQTVELYHDSSHRINEHDNVAFQELLAKKELEPIRQLISLRKLHYIYLLSSYYVGESVSMLEDKRCYFDTGASIVFSGLGASNDRKDVVLFNYKFKDPQAPRRGLFSNTFYTFSEEMKENLLGLDLFSDQNSQLLATEKCALDRDLEISAFEHQELFVIQTYDELRVPQIISYFTKHFYRLEDPRFQALFSYLLFALNKEKTAPVLQDMMKSHTFVKHQLIHFLKMALGRAERLKWKECRCFFFRTLAQVCCYLAASGNDNKALLKETTKWLYKRMEKALSENSEAVAETFISCVPYFDYAEATAHFELCKKAKECVAQRGEINHFEKKLQWQEDYMIGDRLLQTQMQQKGMLPNWIVSHDDYYFGRNFAACQLAESVYEFNDQKGELYRLRMDGNVLHIYRLFNGRWYEHQRKSPFIGKKFQDRDHPCVEGVFARNTRLFCSIEEPKECLVICKKSDKLLCRVNEKGIFHPKEPLTLATNYQAPLITFLTRLVPKKEILVWKNQSQEIVSIELPDFNVNFQLASDGSWTSSSHPGFFLDTQAKCQELEPYSHYLVLRNQKGKRIVILANHGIRSEKQNGFKGRKNESYSLVENQVLMSYALDKKGKLKIPENGEKALYLIYLAMRKGDYALAQKMVNQIKRERPIWEKTWCLWITELDLKDQESEDLLDKHPLAFSLRIQLRLLMQELASNELSKEQKKGLKRDYFTYLEQRKEAFGSLLSTQEELKCLKILEKHAELSDAEKYKIAVRRHSLDNSAMPNSKTFNTSVDSTAKENTFSLSWITADIENKMSDCLNALKPITLLTRPGSAFVDNFLHYYSIARHGKKEDPEYQQLVELLRVTRFMDNSALASLHTLLMNVISNPFGFPTLDEILNRTKPLKEMFDKKISSIQRNEWAFTSKKTQNQHLGKSVSLFSPPNVTVNKAPKPQTKIAYSIDKCLLLKRLETGDYFELQDRDEWKKDIESDLASLDEMITFYSSCKDDNPCVERGFTRLVSGISAKRNELVDKLQKEAIPQQLKQDKIEALKTELLSIHLNYEQLIAEKKKEIFKIAHHYPEDLRFETNGRMLKPLSLEEMLVHFGTGCDEAFYTSNPSLSLDAVKNLKQLLLEFLILSTDDQQALRLSNTLEEKLPLKQKVLAGASIAMQTRVYDPVNEPHLLVFEFFGKIRLRADQYKALIEMTGSEEDIELEARTGFGKSTTLIPLWLFLRSRKEKSAMMTVPSSLFFAQQKHLKKILGKAYDSLIVPIQFNRTKANDEKYLKKLCKQLEEARKEHKIILTTIQSLHGMVNLKLKETLAAGQSATDTDLQKRLLKLREEIATQIAAFFDESKVCFSPRQLFDYAVGSLSSVDPYYFSSACSLYREILSKDGLQTTFNFEFLPLSSHAAKKTPLQDDYEKELLPFFVEAVAARFKVPTHLKQAVLEDLRGHYSEACEEFYKELSPDKLEEYSRLKKQITSHLKRTLYRRCDDSYGFYKNSRLAIPHLDGTPKASSEFSEVEDYIDFTIQANLKKEFKVEEIAAFINQLKIRSVEGNLQEPELELLKKLTSIPLLQLEDQDYQKMTVLLNKDMLLKLDFIEQIILRQIKVYKKKITSTAFSLIRAIHRVHAASGTVDPDSLPPRLHTHEDETAIVDNLLALWKNSQDRIFKFCQGNAEKQLTDILEKRSEEKVLIDVAGTFRELNQESIAKSILAVRKNVKGVVVYDDEGRELVYERTSQALVLREESQLSAEDLFIFIRKSKAIGTDTKIPLSAQALVTVDRETMRDLFLQGTGRMRSLSVGQIAGYVLAPEDHSLIFSTLEPNEKPNFKRLLEYVMRITGKQKGADVFYVLKLYLEDLIDAAFWDAASKCENIQQVQTLFDALKQFIVKETQKSPLTTLRKKSAKVKAEEAVEHLKKEILGPVEAFCKENTTWAHLFNVADMNKKFDGFVDYQKLPKMLDISSLEEGISIVDIDAIQDNDEIQEEETDQINDNELENENENVKDKTIDLPSQNFKPASPVPWLGDYRAIFNGPPSLTLLGIPIYYSPNYLRVSEDETENAHARKPAYQYLVHKDENGALQILLLDLYDARAVLKNMERNRQPSDPRQSFYLLSGLTVIACNSKEPLHSLNSKDPRVLSVNILNKLFTAQNYLSTQERHHLQSFDKASLTTLLSHAKDLARLWPHLQELVSEFSKCFA